MPSSFRVARWLGLPALALLAACPGETPKGTEQKPADTAVAAGRGPVTPCGTCKIITIKMNTTDAGSFFEPNKFEAHQGDVLRFTLVTGVHNVDFLPDSNSGKANLPPASDLLQLPGETKDIKVDFGPGEYYFQCDPHAALGMTGKVKVDG